VGAELKVVHAVGLLEESGLSVGAPPSRDRALQLAGEAGLQPERVEWLALDGPPIDALLRTTEPPIAVDLLVVGTRGTAKHAGVILGSTSLAIAEQANVPVVIVPTAQ
jgi:nucleotide-binding universal stress UspA family protein